MPSARSNSRNRLGLGLGRGGPARGSRLGVHRHEHFGRRGGAPRARRPARRARAAPRSRRRARSVADRREQLVDAVTRRAPTRAPSPVARPAAGEHVPRIGPVDLVPRRAARGDPRASIERSTARTASMRASGTRRAGVDDVHEQIDGGDLVERGAEGLDELVREALRRTRPCRTAARSHRPAARAARGGSRVKRSAKQLRSLAVRDARRRSTGSTAWTCPRSCSRRARPGSRAPRRRALRCVARVAASSLEIVLELLHAPQDAPAVDLELRLTRTSGADATALLAQRVTAAAEARQPVAELRELHLHHALLAAWRAERRCRGSTRRGRPRRRASNASRLRCCAGVSSSSKTDHVDVVRLGVLGELLRLALADVGGRVRRGPAAAARGARARRPRCR